MTDVNEEQRRDRLDDLMVRLAYGRLALGVTSFLAPAVGARLMGAGGGRDAGRDLVTRIFASREIALGAGYLLSGAKGRAMWARLGLMVDTLDAVAGVKAGVKRDGVRGVPLWAASMFTSVAATAAGLGAAKVVKDLTG
ncbi:hypothetical protein [Thermomonospora curvata]|uniref:Uncharacterized protein n=1 Tax=Thermomonospora curvata (strain ATCC 19995 / DSM 43183 / JCM 3096 / KCTC 9072 / NBRC 15933 / NCIMB 10081 / Henssen B9) TaxID=471852 RepID=D1A6F6_THECD|nr:hypothetical protein [Thermomonospora curvata]ACY96431.1 hypothetical protein Tcur_0841 [Thermomonospora curvata DSM 43183]